MADVSPGSQHMAGQVSCNGSNTLHVSLVALPDAVVSTIAGILDVLNGAALMRLGGLDTHPPFHIEIVGEEPGSLRLASGVPFEIQKSIRDVAASDIVIVPSVLLKPEGWTKARYPRLVEWLQRMHAGGAMLCSACSGIFLLAETGIFDGK